MNTTNSHSITRRGRSVFTATATSVILVLATLPANAARDTYYVNADVVDVTPITKTRVVEEPRTVCTVDETPRRSRYTNYDWDAPRQKNDPGAAIVGGLIGGILGNQFGKGNGKKALTIGGALAGAAIASEMHREAERERGRRDRVRWDNDIYDSQESRWTTTESRTITSHEGYRVRYRYHGRTFTRTMDRHPGDTVRIRVRISPA